MNNKSLKPKKSWLASALTKALSSFVFITLVLSSSSLWAQQFYNEIFDQNGQVRQVYQEAYSLWLKMTDAQKAAFLTSSRQAFQGDNALDAMPRMISAEEYDNVLKPGVEQRAKAIRAFLRDHYSGRKEYSHYNVIPQSVVDSLIHRSREEGFDGLLNPQSISFFYGPDIIKDANGTWRVIEDNPGFIGGIGDLRLAQELLKQNMPELSKEIRFRSAEDFYKHVADRFKAEAAKLGGVAVMYMTPPYADKEDSRMRKIFLKYGIRTVTPNTNLQMQVAKDGVYLYDKTDRSHSKEKVGFVFMNGEHWWLDPSHPGSFERLLIEEIEAHIEEPELNQAKREKMIAAMNEHPRDLKKLQKLLNDSDYLNEAPQARDKVRQARGLVQAILQGRVGSNYSPGVDFIGDKEFYLYVENMIRFYLREKPLIRNIPTERFGEVGTNHVNSAVFDQVFADLSKYVIKKVDGRGGDAVWVGPKISEQEIPALKERILSNPSEYIVQTYTPLSRLNDNIVDLRVITDVGPNSIYVTDTPWGRGLPVTGNGKVNLSDEGREITVLIHEGSWGQCKNMFL